MRRSLLALAPAAVAVAGCGSAVAPSGVANKTAAPAGTASQPAATPPGQVDVKQTGLGQLLVDSTGPHALPVRGGHRDREHVLLRLREHLAAAGRIGGSQGRARRGRRQAGDDQAQGRPDGGDL